MATCIILISAMMLCIPDASELAASAKQTPPAPTHTINLTDPVPEPTTEGVTWFAATGHSLRGAFHDYWQAHGGLAQFGYPITEAFYGSEDPDNTALLVQYFERNRFEFHPENAGTPYEVLLGTLGRDFHPQDPQASPLPAPATYFPQTGHNLSGIFARYWQAHEGLAVHGYPITEELKERNPRDGKEYTVQYFERSRYELHPENAGTEYEDLLGLLGRQTAEKKGYSYGWYPRYGRAMDWSWAARRLLSPRMCFTAECSCPLFYIGVSTEGRAFVNAVGHGVRDAYARGLRDLNGPTVVFGHVATPDEQDPVCNPLAPGYFVERMQTNPSQE
jgi:hypothetical protein